MQSEVAVTAAQTRLAEAPYDYKVAEGAIPYSAGGRSKLERDSTQLKHQDLNKQTPEQRSLAGSLPGCRAVLRGNQ
jgi:hypothetical protein